MKQVTIKFSVIPGTGAIALHSVIGAEPKTVVYYNLPTVKDVKKAIAIAVATGTDTVYVYAKGYNTESKVRNFNLSTIAKGLTIAGLQIDAAKYAAKSNKCITDSKYTLSTAAVDKIYSCKYATYVDKDGNISAESLTITAPDNDKRNFRALVRVNENKPLYRAVVLDGKSIDDPKVLTMINQWVESVAVQSKWAKAAKGISVTYDINSTD